MGCVSSKNADEAVEQLVLGSGPAARGESCPETSTGAPEKNEQADEGRHAEPSGQSTPTETTVFLWAQTILRELTAIPVDGSRASSGRAAAVLLHHLQKTGVATAVLASCTTGSTVCVLAGAAGEGTPLLQQQLLTSDAGLSAAVCSAQPSKSPFLYHTVLSADTAHDLPLDWSTLHKEHGLQSFLAVRLGRPDAPVGVLTLAARAPSALQDSWWDALLTMLAPGLFPLLAHPLMAGLVQLAADLDRQQHTEDYKEYAATLLQGAAAFLERTNRSKLCVRLGLLSRDGQALIIQQMGPHRLGQGMTERSMHVLLQQTLIPSEGTMFNSAVAAGGPWMAVDLQQSHKAGDICHSNRLVECGTQQGSVVVVPLLPKAASPYNAALYIASHQAGNFSEARKSIVSLAYMLQLVLQPHFQEGGLLTRVWQEQALQVPGLDAEHRTVISSSESQSSQASTASLVEYLQHQVLSTAAEAKQAEVLAAGYNADIQIRKVLGRGGFGVVYSGRWKGCPAAIKVMMVPQTERPRMKAAMEMAVQSSLSHPNIVRVYDCLTDMVEEPVRCPGELVSCRFRPAGPLDMACGPTCNLIIMELCDGGSLASAVRAGLLHRRAAQAPLLVNMPKLLLVLLDVLRSLQQLHSLGLLHCDLKSGNVLLNSSPGSLMGFVAKLADFGLVKLLDEELNPILNKSISGTVTHLAPERFRQGAMVTPAVDMYAFGVLMFEVYCRQQPFPGLTPLAIIAQVLKGVRPVFPPHTPVGYRALAEACWAVDATQRPTAERAAQQLRDLYNALRG